jgi:hypothetical protein
MTTQGQIDYAISLRDRIREDDALPNTEDDLIHRDRKRHGVFMALVKRSQAPERARTRRGATQFGPDSMAGKLSRFLAPRDETPPLADAIDKQADATIAALLARRAEIAATTDEQIAAMDSTDISQFIDDAKNVPA